MTAQLTAAAARFTASLEFATLPEKAIEIARLGFADTMAVLIAGLDEPVTRAVAAYAAETFRAGAVPCLLGRQSSTPEGAALVDATAAHAHDFDDYAFSNHFSAVLVPAILAATGLRSGVDGRRMVSAYVAGYEVWADLMVREPDHLPSKGWHPTAVFGPVAAAAAVAHVVGLDAAATANALALAASHAGGLMANFGSMTKPYHAGRAAASGIRSVLLTQLGLTAQPNALEDPRGLLAALSPAGNRDLDAEPPFPGSLRIVSAGINIKKYPTVGASQRCIDALLGLVRSREIPLDRIVEIRPRVSRKHAAVMLFDDPKVSAEAKFSLPFACAATLRFGNVSLVELASGKLEDPQLRRLMSTVRVQMVDEYDPEYHVAAPYDMVTIRFDDGTEIETEKVKRATGHADVPLSVEEHWAKFAGCAAYAGVDDKRARRLFDSARKVDALADASDLTLRD